MLRMLDGFDDYNNTFADKTFKGWTFGANGLTITSAAKRYGTAGAQINGSDEVRRWLAGMQQVSSATWFLGCAIEMTISNSGNLFSFYDSATGNAHVRLAYAGNALKVVNSAGTTLGSITGDVLTIGGWNYIQMEVFIHDSLGRVKVKVGPTTVIDLTGQDTRNGTPSTADTLGVGGGGSGAQVIYMDDMWTCDDQGTTNINFLGDCRVESIYPTGAGNYSQFTPSTGSNWQNVDEGAYNGDTDYNSSGTAGNKDSFVYGNLTSTGGTIYGIKQVLVARKDNAGEKTLTTLQRQGGVDYTGTTKSVGDAYTFFEEIVEVNPATGVAWTISDVNTNAEFGYEVVA